MLVLHGYVLDTYGDGSQVLDGQTLTNSASVNTNRQDTVPGTPGTVPGTFDDSVGPATATNLVVEPKLTIHKSVDGGPIVESAELLTYTIAVANTGTSPAYDVVVCDHPDSELTSVAPVAGAALVTDPWTSLDPQICWTITGPIAPGDTVTLTYTAVVAPATTMHAGDQIANTAEIDAYYGVPEPTRDADGFDYRPYAGPQSTVTLTVAIPTLTIVKTLSHCCTVTAGTQASFTITIKNTDAHATAHNVIVTDTLDPGLSYTAHDATAVGGTGFSETDGTGPTIAWLIASLAPGATVTITVPVTVDSDAADGAILVNTAAAHDDEVPVDITDSASLCVEAKSDLAVTKVAETHPIVPGADVVYTMVIRNHGPSDALDTKLEDTLPSYMTFVAIDDTTHCQVGGQAVTCDFGTLADGDSRTIHLTVSVDASRTGVVRNVVDVSTETDERRELNNRAEAIDEITPAADVSIHKSADRVLHAGGDTVTYTLVAHNAGPSVANAVTLDDDVPPGLTFVSVTPGSPVCSHVAGHVHCNLGALPAGADRTVTIVTTANAVTAGTAVPGIHAITLSKVQESRVVAPGASTTADVSCPADGSAADGSVRLVSAGSFADLDVVEARSIARGTYRFAVFNGSPGNAQVTFVVTCLPRATDPDSHAHEIEVGALQTLATGPLTPGRHVRTIPGTAGHHAVAPGIVIDSGRARLVRSEPDGSGRTFTIDVLATAQVRLGTRALDDDTAPAGTPAHVHELAFTHVVREVFVTAGTSEHVVECPPGRAGLVASYDVPEWASALGNDWHPAGRTFWLFDASPAGSHAILDLECLDVLTGRSAAVAAIVNTATVTTTSADPIAANDAGHATIGVRRPAPPPPGGGGGLTQAPASQHSLGEVATPITPPPPGPVAVDTTRRLRIGTVSFSPTATTATLRVTCMRTTACSGKITLTAPGPRTKALKTITLGKAPYSIKPGKTATVRVTIAKRHRAGLRSGAVDVVTIISGKTKVTRKVVLRPARAR